MTDGQTISFKGGAVFVREVGSGPPVLLINGLGAHSAMWHTLETTLEGHRLLQFDLPGAGRSAVPRTGLSIRDLALLATQVMDHFGVQTAPVIGYSMGGVVTQQLAHDHPDRVERAVLVATTPGRGGFRGDARAMVNIITPVRYMSPTLYANTIGTMVGGRARHDAAWVAEQGLLRLQQAPTWRGYLGQLQSLSRWSGFSILHDIPHPVLVLTGEDDPLVPVVNAMILTYLLPNGRMMVLRHEGHLMMMDASSRLHAAVSEFIRTADLDASPVWAAAEPVSLDELKIALAGAERLLELPWGRDARIRHRYLDVSAAAAT
jgi:pimeloyl-ACP methyl ester carboxylesterase